VSIFGLSFLTNAQRADSLKSVLPSAKGADRFDVLYELAYEFSNEVDSISLVYATQAYELAVELGDTARIIKGGRIKAAQLRRLENFEAAIKTAELVLPIAKRHRNVFETKILLTSLAISHVLRAEYDMALKYNFESLVIREAEGNKKEMSISLNNIGLIYYKLSDFARALEYYKKSLNLKNEVGDTHDKDRLLINIGLCYNALGDYDEAKKFVGDGLNFCEGKCTDQIILEGEIALGVSLLESGNGEEALGHFLKSLEAAKLIKNHRFQAENLVSIARVYLKKEDFKSAKNYLTQTEAIAKERGFRFLLTRTYDLFSILYEKTHDYQNQARYQLKYIKLKDSILSEKVISNLSQLRTDYQERENIKTIAEKDQVLTLQKEVIIRQQRQYYFIMVIACLVVALAGISYYFSKRQQKANREISKAKNLIQEQNERLESHNRELEGKVSERTGDLLLSNKALQKLNDELDYFIYKSSHDIRGPLATLKGMCNIALMDLKDPTAINYFKKFDLTTDKLNVILTRLQMVNYVSHSHLKPEVIDFKTILRETIEFERRKDSLEHFSFTYEIGPDCDIISDEFLVRTILENLIDNAVKFRNQSQRVNPFVKIKLTKESRVVRLTVEDNGIGIGSEYANDLFKMFVRASEQSEIGGVGLYLIKLAIDKAGGEVSLINSSPNGSIFQVLFPSDINEVISIRNKNEKKLVEMLMKQGEQPATTPVS
jgi:signal transduction histidine kinase